MKRKIRISCPPAQKSQGFTLLEVLVAMTVLALALLAISKAAAGFIDNQAYLRDRTFAQWVARNQLLKVQLSDEWPSVGEQKDEVEFPAERREWRWVMNVIQTSEKDLRRLDIEVFPVDAEDGAAPLAVLSGFLERPSDAR
jgi:general secretion pathway protein I